MHQHEHFQYIHPETIRANVTRFPSADDLHQAVINLAGFYRSKPLGPVQVVRARIADEVVGYAKFHGCRRVRFVNITNRAFSCFACTVPAAFEIQFYEKMNPGEGNDVAWPTTTRWGCCSACRDEMARADRENSFGDDPAHNIVHFPPTLDLRRLPMACDTIEMLKSYPAVGMGSHHEYQTPTNLECAVRPTRTAQLAPTAPARPENVTRGRK
jgi:hypothetical protein